MPLLDIHICRAGQGSAGAEGRAGMVPAAEIFPHDNHLANVLINQLSIEM